VNFLARLFVTPDGFTGSPWGFARNQAGHMAICAALAWALGLPTALAIYAAWETAQWLWQGAEPWDCLEDAAFGFSGALATVAPEVLAPASLFLASGFARRRRKEPA
jgi:phosphotransferase system  glucose/maltose/N-acetylglucosamine-specific IIC component